jgi:sialic acid synthase SpsE
LHCISIYPTTPSVASLSRIKFLKSLTSEVGFSDHSNPDIYSYDLSAIAKTLGATWFERHFTILKKNETKDGVVSVNPKQLLDLRNILNEPNREITKIMKSKYKKNKFSEIIGSTNRELSDEEILNRDYYKGRFISKTISKKVAYNWDSKIKLGNIKQV